MIRSLVHHPGVGSFARGFFEVHLVEIDFLLDHRRAYFDAPSLAWTSAEGVEARLTAHVEAMGAWGRAGLDFARAALADEDSGPPAALIVAAQGSDEDIAAACSSLEGAGSKAIPRFMHALSIARGRPLSAHLAPMLESPSPELRAIAAEILGLRREGPADRIEALLVDASLAVRATAARALARLGHKHAAPVMEALLEEDPGSNAGAFAVPLIELGSARAPDLLRRLLGAAIEPEPPVLFALAIAGEAADARLLQAHGVSPADTARALGLLGAPSAVPWLLGALAGDDPALRAEASLALARITGAGLTEEAEVDVPGEEDAGIPPAKRRIERPSSSHADWERWWAEGQRRFRIDARYRAGRPLDAIACLDEIESPGAPIADRRRAAIELAWRSPVCVPFEADGPVAEQRSAVLRWRAALVPGGR
jgi:uncharacterized protein (TIGR02270 family)